MKILIEESVLRKALDALMIHSKHYECEDTFYSCPADETAWEDRKGECCCGADSANAAITVLRTALDDAEKVEPVAWHGVTGDYGFPFLSFQEQPGMTPLYSAPAVPKVGAGNAATEGHNVK